MTSQLASYAIRLNVKYDHPTIELSDVVSERALLGGSGERHTLPEAKKSPR